MMPRSLYNPLNPFSPLQRDDSYGDVEGCGGLYRVVEELWSEGLWGDFRGSHSPSQAPAP